MRIYLIRATLWIVSSNCCRNHEDFYKSLMCSVDFSWSDKSCNVQKLHPKGILLNINWVRTNPLRKITITIAYALLLVVLSYYSLWLLTRKNVDKFTVYESCVRYCLCNISTSSFSYPMQTVPSITRQRVGLG